MFSRKNIDESMFQRYYNLIMQYLPITNLTYITQHRSVERVERTNY